MAMEVFNENKNFIPALLAIAQALIIRKDTTQARNNLKKIAVIARRTYTPAFADDFEKAW